MGLFRFFRSLWRARQRQADVAILWPVCRLKAKTIEGARDLFALHAQADPAWQELDQDHIRQIIDALE